MFVFGLPLGAAAFAVDFAVRRWVRRLSWPRRAGLWIAVMAGGPVIVSRYGGGAGAYAFAYQQRPREVSLQDGHCSLRHLAGTGTTFYDGPCRELRTPHGRAVFVGARGTRI